MTRHEMAKKYAYKCEKILIFDTDFFAIWKPSTNVWLLALTESNGNIFSHSEMDIVCQLQICYSVRNHLKSRVVSITVFGACHLKKTSNVPEQLGYRRIVWMNLSS